MTGLTQRRLMAREELAALLQLSEPQVQQLIDTRQIQTIRICGEARFDSLDLYRLIETYKATAARRAL
jgi:hypothetical protein